MKKIEKVKKKSNDIQAFIKVQKDKHKNKKLADHYSWLNPYPSEVDEPPEISKKI